MLCLSLSWFGLVCSALLVRFRLLASVLACFARLVTMLAFACLPCFDWFARTLALGLLFLKGFGLTVEVPHRRSEYSGIPICGGQNLLD